MRHRPGRRGPIGLVGTLAVAVAVAAAVVAAGCGADPSPGPASHSPTPSLSPAPGPILSPAPTTDPSGRPAGGAASRPSWLGTRELPVGPDGYGEIRDTPPELVDRRFPPPDARPLPDEFTATVERVPDDVVTRSTWVSECPVTVDELRYLTMTFRGFDGRSYAGEMIVHRSVADEVVSVFAQLYDARFPIEKMRVVAPEELDAPPTGDGNNTTAFVCRPVALGSSWSQHAYGLAIDINPFHNPYRRGDTVLPELASAYLDRGDDRPGMIHPGDVVTRAFADIGWGWGGEWTNLDDWMHFSQSGR